MALVTELAAEPFDRLGIMKYGTVPFGSELIIYYKFEQIRENQILVIWPIGPLLCSVFTLAAEPLGRL